MSRTKPSKPAPEPREELQAAALAWAEYLYDEYMLNKHKQLLLGSDKLKMEADKRGSNE